MIYRAGDACAGLLLPEEPAEHSAALVAFSVASWDGEELTRTLRERWAKAIIVRPLTIVHNGVRASVPFFLLEEEIDLLAAAVHQLAESRP